MATFILQIETATTNCSVAIAKEGVTIAYKEVSNGYSHAENLHVFIKEVVEESGITLNDLSAIAVSKGPGSYTGLRIGVSAAKGMCFALDIPLLAIETLDVLARQIKLENGFIVPMLDARRMEAYTCVYKSDFSRHREIQAEVLTEESFNDILIEDKVFFIGNAIEKLKPLIDSPNAFYIESLPSAKELSWVAYNKLKKNDIEDVAYFEPYYLKDFIVTPSKK